jgi:hypothetical protein
VSARTDPSRLVDPNWLALPEKRRSELLEEYHDINVVCEDWHEHVFEGFQEQCAEQGIRVDEMYFSGFWSQGDGACFEGEVAVWEAFLKAFGRPELFKLTDEFTLKFSCRHHGHYNHSGCTRFDSELSLMNPFGVSTYLTDDGVEEGPDNPADQLQWDTWRLVTKSGSIFEKLEGEFIKFFRSRMDDLYKMLNEEYDYQTSEEQVVDFILESLEGEALTGPVEEEDQAEEFAL